MQTWNSAFRSVTRKVCSTVFTATIFAAASMSGNAQNFSVVSPDVRNSAIVPLTFSGCDQQFNNVSPALTWSGAPEGTKSYVVTLASRRGDQLEFPGWQWIVYNIPASATSLRRGAGNDASNALPEGAVNGASVAGGRSHGYYGPCPLGDETERYVFSVYALKVARVESLPGFTGYLGRKDLESVMLAKTSFTVLMKR